MDLNGVTKAYGQSCMLRWSGTIASKRINTSRNEQNSLLCHVSVFLVELVLEMVICW